MYVYKVTLHTSMLGNSRNMFDGKPRH